MIDADVLFEVAVLLPESAFLAIMGNDGEIEEARMLVVFEGMFSKFSAEPLRQCLPQRSFREHLFEISHDVLDLLFQFFGNHLIGASMVMP